MRTYARYMREEQLHIPVKASMAFARLWNAKGTARGTVVLVHGIAEHSARYQQFALFLAHNGYNVLAYDQRGHGYTAINSSHSEDPISLKKHLYDNPDFGLIPLDEGWRLYLDDLSHVLEYVFSRYDEGKIILFGHSMGSMIVRAALATLPPGHLGRISGVILSGHPENGKLLARLGLRFIMHQIKRHGESHVSAAIDDLVLGRYHKNKRYSGMRTELDWISSIPDEVDAYIADPLCGNILRLGAYAALVDINIYVYSRQYRRELADQSIPLLFFCGSDDPVAGFGKTPGLLAEFYKKLGWDQCETAIYEGCRHEVFHDALQAKAFDDCLRWIENRL